MYTLDPFLLFFLFLSCSILSPVGDGLLDPVDVVGHLEEAAVGGLAAVAGEAGHADLEVGEAGFKESSRVLASGFNLEVSSRIVSREISARSVERASRPHGEGHGTAAVSAAEGDGAAAAAAAAAHADGLVRLDQIAEDGAAALVVEDGPPALVVGGERGRPEAALDAVAPAHDGGQRPVREDAAEGLRGQAQQLNLPC